MRKSLCALVSLCSMFALAAAVRADEIRLKNGSKIIGNIVGIEDGSFKVETAYGFAMIRKDSIAEIIPTASGEAKQPAAPRPAATKPAEEPAHAAAKPSAASPATPPSSTASAQAKQQSDGPRFIDVPEPKSPPADASAQPATVKQPPQQPAPAAAATAANSAATTSVTMPTSASAPASASEPPSAPTAVAPSAAANIANSAEAAPATGAAATAEAAPEPPPVREMVRGNLYFNETYGFEMFRAPDWEPIVAARAALPNAIAALGTGDQSTLLIIGRDRAHDSLEAQSAATEKRIQEIYQNYRPLPSQRITVAGAPAIERQFRGAAEHRDWSVTVVTFQRDGSVFTILAMTDANSEFVQMEQNVIAKAVASLQFTTSFSESTARKLPPSLDDSR
jgi:hypothetical protein